jgi:FHA domain
MDVDVGSKLVNISVHMPPNDANLTPTPSSASENEAHAAYQLIVVGPEDGGRTFDLGAGRHLLGRAPEADLRFSLETISRHHALFVVDGDHVTLEDLGSRVGTFVNGRRISSCSLANGARIVIGGVTMKLVKA